MATPSTETAHDYADDNIWLWVWFVAATFTTAIVFGFLFPYGSTDAATGEPLPPTYGWPAFFGGLAVGAVGSIPVMIAIRTLFRIQRNTALAADRLRTRAPQD